ncbi:MAG: hypothetical protein APR54_08600 [Candidatus Cloacimonas sp. SDB]|nr:MAG: hypothetical protein APR54_08600 [Candidatus Cloacimonas sp. SDB]
MPTTTILITGISGFVGGHYCSFLCNNRKDWTIHGISRSKPSWDFIHDKDSILNSVHFHQADLLDEEKIHELIKEIRPDYILHLAAFSSVAESWQKPRAAFQNNTNAFLNVIESIRALNYQCRILSVGSSEEYGIVDQETLPLKEESYSRPANPYAVARLSQEYLANIYMRGFNMDICCTRSFNHIGPGQQPKFVISSIARQFAEIIVKEMPPIIEIGDDTIVRDFIDIDDVVRAYDAIFKRGMRGEIYNVCNGCGYSIAQIIAIYSKILDQPIRIEQQENLIRPIDNPVIIGNNEKITDHTGWKPRIKIKESLEKIYEYWQIKISRNNV